MQTEYEPQRPTWAEIDLDAVRSNFACVQTVVGRKVKIAPAVKADAYGHGAAECARVLEAAGAEFLCVALPEEGLRLRRAGINARILSLNGFWSGQEALCLRERLTPVVYRADMLESLNQAARDANVVAGVHVKIDTGMGRLGVRFDAVREFAEALARCKHTNVEAVMTHFAAADERAKDDFTRLQFERYTEALEILKTHGVHPRYTDLANSAAIYSHPQTHGNLVRPGGVIYGLRRDVLQAEIQIENHELQTSETRRDEGESEALWTDVKQTIKSREDKNRARPLTRAADLRSVMSVRTCITLLKEIGAGETLGYGCTFQAARRTQVATLPFGYADGVPRPLSNKGQVIIRGQLAPIIGRVSMDLTLVDVTDVEGVEHGDVATFIGSDGRHEITAEHIGRLAGTFSYEITCGISARVPRRFMNTV